MPQDQETASRRLAGRKQRPGVVAASVYREGACVADIEIAHAGAWRQKPGHVVWIGLHEPEPGLLHEVQDEFDLPDLAIEDAGKAHQRPKLEQYGDVIFVVARTAQMAGHLIEFGETHLFVGKGFVVSVRHGASTSYLKVRERCEATPGALSQGEDYILYAILDFIVDNYMPVLETIEAEVDHLEEQVLAHRLGKAGIERLYQLRRELLRLRNAVVPLVEVCRKLEHADLPGVDPAMRPLFRDITDHVRRIQEEIDTLREVLAFAFEANIMIGQSDQTDVARKLASWAAILAVPTAVAGIYGMNFSAMPELQWHYGYPAVLLAIVTVCGVLWWRFRKLGWI